MAKTSDAPNAVVAAAKRLDLDDKTEAARLHKRREKWQTECWDFYDLVGELKAGIDFIGDALSKVRIFAARRVPGANDPQELTEGAAAEAMARIADSATGHAEILRGAAQNLSVAGECYQVGWAARPAEKDRDKEIWEIRSVEEVNSQGDKVFVSDGPSRDGAMSGQGRELTGDDFIMRMWRPHPRFHMKADSPVRGVMSALQELLALERASRAIAKSRLAGSGILLVPDELSFGKQDETADDGSDPEEDPFLEDLEEAMIEPLKDEGHASAVVPLVVRGPAEALKEFRHIVLERKWDAELDQRTERALKRTAQGINLPVEVLLGIGDLNHWSAWQVDESTFKYYLEPLLIMICAALTSGYLRPILGEESSDDIVVWYDPAELVVRPNRSQEVADAHDRLAASDEAYREAIGLDEDDAPSDEEIARRISWKNARPAVQIEQGDGDEPPAAPGPPEDQPDSPDDEASLTAAGRRGVQNLGQRLGNMDRILRERVLAASESALRRALERAGARIRTQAKKQSAIAASIEGVRQAEVAATLGQRLVASLGLDEEQILQGAFASLQSDFETWTAEVQKRALDMVPELTASERDDAEHAQAEDRAEAWTWLEAALLTLSRDRLFDPSPAPPAEGEFDASVMVPYGVIREAIARAGGAGGPAEQTVIAAGVVPLLTDTGAHVLLGLADGWLMKGIFGDHGIVTEEFEWVYGDYPRTRPFEPHEDLDGARFDNFDAPVLRNEASFPPGEFYLPGDHDGCRCDFMSVMVEKKKRAAA